MMAFQPYILVVDDDPYMTDLLGQILGSRGYAVEALQDGDTALRQVAMAPPDLMIVDVMMPDMDGLEVLHRVRDLSDLPVIALSGRSDARCKAQAHALGVAGYLTKPFHPDELLAMIDAVMLRLNARVRM